MALILFVIIAVYLLVRVSADKAGHQEAEKEFEEVRHHDDFAKKEWELRTTNKILEAELLDKLLSRDASVMDELRTTWERYYETEFPQYVVHDEKGRYLSDGSRQSISDYNCLRILMCNRGFLTYADAMYGIQIAKTGETEGKAQLSYHRMIRFVKRLNEKLLSRDIRENVYLELTDGSIYMLDENSSGVGIVKWRPVISTFKLKLSNTNRGTNFL